MNRIYTVGHSNHPLERFLELLASNNIDVVADVRSSPASGYSPQFLGAELSRSIQAAGRQYVFLGDQLGGRPEDPALYDNEGHVLYEPLASSAPFRSGIDRLLRGAATYRIALLCGEEDPTSCHRRRLIGHVLAERGIEVLHLRGDGRVQTEHELELEEQVRFPERFQLSLLTIDGAWRSTKPVPSRARVTT